MLLDSCVILRLYSVNPRFLKAGDIKAGEKDSFHFLAKEGDEWYFHKRIDEGLSVEERRILAQNTESLGTSFDPDSSENVIRMKIPDFQAALYDDINKIPGCRVSPVTLQHGVDVFISIEYDHSRTPMISERILEYLNGDATYVRGLLYMGQHHSNLPYLLNVYSSLGNSFNDLVMIRTRWSFNDASISIENQGVFQNPGTIIPKEFADNEQDRLIWKLRSDDIKGDAHFESVDPSEHISEVKVESKFFSDFYRNIVRKYTGPIFYGLECDGKGLTNSFIIEKRARNEFLSALKTYWSLQARQNHLNYLIEMGDFDNYRNSIDLPF
ncbi:MAG: hypothetical protein ACYDAZ_01570 [Thermoplasmataceae archaeon]